SSADPLEKKKKATQIIVDLINNARQEGIDVFFDVIPSISGGGSSNPNFGRFFRPWVLAAGSYDQFLRNLNIPDYVEAIKRDVKNNEYGWLKLGEWPFDEMIFIVKSEVKEFENKSVRTIMKEKGWNFIDAMIEICKRAPYTKIRFDINTPNEWIQEILKHPLSMPCSDGLSFNQDSEFGLDFPLNVYPHPNNFCYTIRYLTQYPKERLEDSIRAMTGLPAEVFNIKDRGVLKEGNYADIVVFSPKNLATNENYITPGTFPDGINYVIINGQITAKDKKHTGAKAGRFL
ncbi:MAG: amidohydrolase family protein, partial [Promethearchaeota archaeon]